jgi:hypothetical protein
MIRGDEVIHDYWKRMKKQLRKLSKGMGVNLDSQMKRKRKEILGRIEEMDDKAEAHGLCEEDWKWRYKLEGDLEEGWNMKNKFGSRGAGNSGY